MLIIDWSSDVCSSDLDASAVTKVIISCAVTGSIHTPSMSPHLPVTAAGIADAALGAAEAGDAIVHLHARNPVDGRPDQSPEAFEPFLRAIKVLSNVVVKLTTGGSPYLGVEERVRPAEVGKPEMVSIIRWKEMQVEKVSVSTGSNWRWA